MRHNAIALKITSAILGLYLSLTAYGACDTLKESDCKSNEHKSHCEWSKNICQEKTPMAKPAKDTTTAKTSHAAVPTKPTPTPSDLGTDDEGDDGEF